MIEDNGELIKAQNEVIGILFEVIKKLQENIDLQEEGVHLIIKSKDSNLEESKTRLDEITEERNKNSDVISRLLKKLDSN
ncbi:MAG: hydrolase [Candidatus Nitrosopelagicus sp.]|nr:hydrolase [Candidatus Nitrosopelagicus sp.]